MRQISAELYAQLFKQDSNDPFLLLVTIVHPTYGVIRLVSNTEDITSRGNVYTALPMNIVLPVDDGETQREVSITIDNVGLELINYLRTTTLPMDVTLELVLASLPNVVQIEVGEMKIKDVTYDQSKISARLYLDDFLNTEVISERYTPTVFPSIF